MPGTNAFSTVAEFYDVLADRSLRLAKEGPLLLEQVTRIDGKKVLDIACGTGIHAYFLAEHGASVTAVDLSSEMLDYARSHRAHPSIQYVQSDMRSLPEGMWDMAICLGNSISLLRDEGELNCFFRNLAKRVRPGGIFISQTLNYVSNAARQPRHRVETKELDTTRIVAIKNMIPVGSVTLVTLEFFSQQSGEWRNISDWAILRNWTTEELTSVATASGFDVVKVFGSFHGEPYDPNASSDVVSLFERKLKID